MNQLMRLLGLGAIAAVLYEELRKPSEERTWEGKAMGFLPYSFRRPTAEALRAAYWDPDNDTILTDKVFGIGWAVNFGALARRAGLVPPTDEASSD